MLTACIRVLSLTKLFQKLIINYHFDIQYCKISENTSNQYSYFPNTNYANFQIDSF